jgi:DNA-binding NarL/FixJ family response regulator
LRQPVRLVVVDDHVFMRELITRALSRHSLRYKVLGEAADARGAISECQAHQPDLLILDVNLPDRSGVETVSDVHRVAPQTRILLCSAFANEDRLRDAIASGADGFVEKTHSWHGFLAAVDCVSRGERYFHSSYTPAAHASAAPGAAANAAKVALSPREQEVLKLIAAGKTSKEVATCLQLSVQTVETYRANLMSKLEVHNVAGLVLFAVRSGLLR